MCEGNRITSDCEAADHDCSKCASSDGAGGCSHGNIPEPGERTMSDYLELTYRQNQVIVMKLDAYVKDLEKEGKIEWELPEGKKSVVIYLPADATVHIKNFEIDAAAQRPEKNEKVLWLGDSITQGFGPLRSGQTYVCVANRILNYDIINQGIGGYVYDKKSLMKMEGYEPDKIIVALGTNQYGCETMKDVEFTPHIYLFPYREL